MGNFLALVVIADDNWLWFWLITTFFVYMAIIVGMRYHVSLPGIFPRFGGHHSWHQRGLGCCTSNSHFQLDFQLFPFPNRWRKVRKELTT